MLFTTASRGLSALLSLAIFVGVAGALSPTDQGRIYFYVLDSSGNPTDGTDDVELRPSSAPTPGNAIDGTYMGGFSSTWYWDWTDLDRTEKYDLYVNLSSSSATEIGAPGWQENSVATVTVQDDAITPAKIDDDANFVLNPTSSSPALLVDFDTSNPSGGYGIEVDFSSNSATGFGGTLAQSGQTGMAWNLTGTGNPTGISISNSASGNSANGIKVTNNPSSGTSSALYVVSTSGSYNGIRIDNTSSANSSQALSILNAGTGAVPYGIYAVSSTTGRTAYLSSPDCALYIDESAPTDTSMCSSGGRVVLDRAGQTYSSNALLSVPNWSGSYGGIAVDSDPSHALGTNLYFARLDGVNAASCYYGVASSSSGTQSIFDFLANGSEVIGVNGVVTNGVGMWLNDGGLTPAEASGQMAILQNDDVSNASEALRIEYGSSGNAMVIDHHGTPSGTVGGIYSFSTATSSDFSLFRGGISTSSSAAKGIRLETATGWTGDGVYLYHNGSALSGSGIDAEFVTGVVVSGDGYIDIDEEAETWNFITPVIDIDVTQSSTSAIRIDVGGSGTAIDIDDAGTAINVDNGIVDLNTSDQLFYRTGTSDPTGTFSGSTYFNTSDNELYFYNGGWRSLYFPPAAAREITIARRTRQVTLTASDFDAQYLNPADNADGAQPTRIGNYTSMMLEALVFEGDTNTKEVSWATLPPLVAWDGDSVFVSFKFAKTAASTSATTVWSVHYGGLSDGDYFYTAPDTTLPISVAIADNTSRFFTVVDTLVAPWATTDDVVVVGIKRLQNNAGDDYTSDVNFYSASVEYYEE